MNNSIWAFNLIDQFVLQGISNFCIAPGSRSTPLALAAARHKKAKIHVHFDERGLGFFALGIGLAQQTPAVVIVTSGTAVGNLLPAVMESAHSHVPLILLTADRPPELRDCGANQTTDQIKIFQNFVLWQSDIPCPDPSISIDYIRSQAVHSYLQSMKMGPVHLNCQFREPLFSSSSPEETQSSPQPIFFPTLAPAPALVDHCLQEITSDKTRGLIIIGRMPPKEDLTELFYLAKRLRWPIYADLLSGGRGKEIPESIRHLDLAIQSKIFPTPNIVFHFGGSLISKQIPEWLHQIHCKVFHIHRFSERIDPFRERPLEIHSDPTLFCQAIHPPQNPSLDFLELCQKIDTLLDRSIRKTFQETAAAAEAKIIHALGQEIPDPWNVFFANSMPIRDGEHHFFPKNTTCIYANRGLSGIDGQIATAAGIASASQKPLIAILGDQSCLHDLNSLALLQSIQTPFVLIIFNNFGGGIFSRLPVAQEKEHFEKVFSNTHSLCFEKAAQTFNLDYQSGLPSDWAKIFSHPKPLILEIFTSHKNNTSFENQIMENCLHFKPIG